MTSALQKTAMCIVLSGLPCTGKSTWSEKFISKAKLNGMSVKVVSSDAISYRICDEHNQKVPAEERLNYATVWKFHRQKIEDTYQADIMMAKSEADVVILDRTHTTFEARAKALKLAEGIPSIHLLSMRILNEKTWNDKLMERNQRETNKLITPEIIGLLKRDASDPAKTEGFHSILACSAIGEPEWEDTFDASIDRLIDAFSKS